MQTLDAQGTMVLQPGQGHGLNDEYPSKDEYFKDEYLSNDLPHFSKDHPLLLSRDISLAPPTEKEERQREKMRKKQEKLEHKMQRIENKMIARLPTHMVIYSVPLIANQDLLLLTNNIVPPGRIREKIETRIRAAHSSRGMAGGVRGRTVRWANRSLEAIQPDERLLSNTPSNISHITIVHPESVPGAKVYEDLTTQTYRLLVYGAAFPFIAAAEGLIPVWPNIFTVVDAAFIIYHYKAYKGAKRLISFEANNKEHIACSPTSYIDKWIAILAKQRDGVLNEEQITIMCTELGAPEMIQMLNELRRDYLRKINRTDLLSPLEI